MSDYTISIGEYNNVQLDTQNSLIGSYQIYNANSWQQIFYRNLNGVLEPITSRFCPLPFAPSSIAAIPFKPSTLDYSAACTCLRIKQEEFTYYTNSCVIRSSESAVDTIQCNVFTKDRMENYPTPQYGMMVFDENGSVIFNSNCNILKIQEICQFSLNNLPITISHNTQNPFYLVPYASMQTYTLSRTSTYLPICFIKSYIVGIKKVSATQFSVNWIIFDIYGVGGASMIPEDYSEYMTIMPNPFSVALCTL